VANGDDDAERRPIAHFSELLPDRLASGHRYPWSGEIVSVVYDLDATHQPDEISTPTPEPQPEMDMGDGSLLTNLT